MNGFIYGKAENVFTNKLVIHVINYFKSNWFKMYVWGKKISNTSQQNMYIFQCFLFKNTTCKETFLLIPTKIQWASTKAVLSVVPKFSPLLDYRTHLMSVWRWGLFCCYVITYDVAYNINVASKIECLILDSHRVWLHWMNRFYFNMYNSYCILFNSKLYSLLFVLLLNEIVWLQCHLLVIK